MSGKGSTPRPFTNREKFEAEFERIFGKEKQFDENVNNGELLDELKEKKDD